MWSELAAINRRLCQVKKRESRETHICMCLVNIPFNRYLFLFPVLIEDDIFKLLKLVVRFF